MEGPNWRSGIREGSRPAAIIQRVESRVPEELGELRQKAIQLEEQIFNTATSYDDYVIKFAKMMESIEMEAWEQLRHINGEVGLIEPLVPIKKETPLIMDGHMKSINNAYEKYLAAANTALAVYRSACGCHKLDAINQALVKFTEERMHFLSACISADSFIITMKGRNKELEAADKTEVIEMGLGHLYHIRNILTLSDQTLTSCFSVMTNQTTMLDKVRVCAEYMLKFSSN